MSASENLTLLQRQITEANNGEPENLDLWQQRTEVVLRNVLGRDHPIYRRFLGIRYSPLVVSINMPKKRFDDARSSGVRTAINSLQAAIAEIEITRTADASDETNNSSESGIFIVHGHDEARKFEVARTLERVLPQKHPVILHEQPNKGRTIIEKFEGNSSTAAYAIVLATADDVGRAKDEKDLRTRARQNVIFELGFFYAALGRARVALLYDEGIEIPSDIDGIVRIPLDQAGGWKLQLARELAEQKYPINWEMLL